MIGEAEEVKNSFLCEEKETAIQEFVESIEQYILFDVIYRRSGQKTGKSVEYSCTKSEE
jgi:hypothetical protein